MAKLIKEGNTIIYTDGDYTHQRYWGDFKFRYASTTSVSIRIDGDVLFDNTYANLLDVGDAPYTDVTLKALLSDFNGGGGGVIALVPLTDAANITWTLDNNAINTVTLADNRILDNPSILTVGTYVLYVIQDAIGSRTLSYGAAFKFPNGNAPTLTATPNAIDILTFICDGVSMYSVSTPNFL